MHKLFGGGAIVLLFLAGCTTEVQAPQAPADNKSPPTTTGGTVEAPAVCIEAGAACKADTDECCNGAACVSDVKDPQNPWCADSCLEDSQCKSGCCAVLKSGTQKVCSPAKYCAGTCADGGESCATSTCCDGHVCVSSSLTGPTRCAATCRAHSDCKSGCCSEVGSSGVYACGPMEMCQ